MRVLVVDDEPLARERLSHLVEEMEDAELAGVAASGEQALMLAGTLRPEVVLLDIRMPGMDGLEAARHLARMPDPPAVIFTTAFDEHALAAFEVQAAGYVLKPVRQEKLVEAIARARQPNRAQLTRIADGAGGGPRTRIAVRTRDELKLIPVESIICFTAEQKYTTLRHAGGEELIEEPLKALENEFAGSFLRIHRNSLVAFAHVEGLERDAEGRQVVRLRSGAGTLAVSRRLAADVARRLKG
ncbi:MAG: LytTR family DNA-binding domain-containing protein [Steroidobacteraceae bacterium]